MKDKLATGSIDPSDTLGSAHAGVRDWWAERLSAIALAPLGLWFLVGFAVHARAGYSDCLAWLRAPASSVAMLLLLLVLFRHLELGLRVIVEDYVHSAAKLPLLISARLLCLALVVAGAVAQLRLLLGR